MKIPQNLKQITKKSIGLGMEYKDLICFGSILILTLPIWIVLFLNSQTFAGIGVLFVSIAVAGILVLPFKGMKIYLWIARGFKHLFNRIKNDKVCLVRKIDENIVYLNDENKTIFGIYRIEGLDIFSQDEETVSSAVSGLRDLFAHNENCKIYKMDCYGNTKPVFKYIANIAEKQLQNAFAANEIEYLKKYTTDLCKNTETQTSNTYFLILSLPKDANDEVNWDKASEVYANAAADCANAGIPLSLPTNEQINSVLRSVFYVDTTIDEKYKTLHITRHRKVNLPETFFKGKDLDRYKVREPFMYEKYCYYKDENNNYYINSNSLNKTKPEWKQLDFDLSLDWNTIKDKVDSNGIYTENFYQSFVKINKFPSDPDFGWLQTIFNTKGIEVLLETKLYDAKNAEKDLTNAIDTIEEKFEKNVGTRAVQKRNAFELEALEETLDYISVEDGKLCDASIILKFSAETPQKLSKLIRQFVKKNSNRNTGFGFQFLYFQQFEALKKFIPLETTGKIKLDAWNTITDYSLGESFAFSEQELQDKDALPFGTDNNGNIIALDYNRMGADKNSSSTILFAKTGGGKTTTQKRILANQFLQDKYKIFVIDPENEYCGMIRAFGGEVIDLSKGTTTINCLDLQLPDKFNNEQLLEAIQAKGLFLQGLLRIMFEGAITDLQRATLLQTINNMYIENKGKEFIWSDVYHYLDKHKAKIADAETLKLAITPYCSCVKGVFAYMFDKKTNISLENNYIDFKFRDLLSKSGNSALGRTLIYITLQYINNMVLNNRVDNSRYINIVLDEAHLLMDPRYMDVVLFITEMFKRARKYNAMMTLITQNINDFNKPEIKQYTQALIKNSFYLIVLGLRPQEIEDLDELMREQGGLTDTEKEHIKNAKAGSGILMFNKTRARFNCLMVQETKEMKADQ